MSAATHPIQICDDESGCPEWALDIPATGARIVSGSDPLEGWFVDRYEDVAYCPEHRKDVPR
jgi:hypothetical protein